MKIIKKINTSAAIALDSGGKEIVVFGKGIGFPSVPYELTDLEKIERTFYDVDTKYYGLLSSIPSEILSVSAKIVENAEVDLKNKLNPNLVFTLADHLAFTITRFREGIDLVSPISYDISHLYPKEYEIGKNALLHLNRDMDIQLPETEAISITMHIINAEVGTSSLKELMKTTKIIEGTIHIVEDFFYVELDKKSYEYSRFVMHLRYLIIKLKNAEYQEVNGHALMLRTLSRENPNAYLCANKIVEYLKKTWGLQCNEEEKLYLMLHITRIIDMER